ncbi:MAG: hypothetical protein NTY19_46375 [Planctomycetota bacterium]|nr:hypothetical protein [Planctomycetota bacterium]
MAAQDIAIWRTTLSGIPHIFRKLLYIPVWILLTVPAQIVFYYVVHLSAVAENGRLIESVKSLFTGNLSVFDGPEGLARISELRNSATWVMYGLAALSVFSVAVVRSVLTPKRNRFLYLRFGRAEFWQAINTLATFVILTVMSAIVYLPVFLLCIFVVEFGGLSGHNTVGLAKLVLVLGVVVGYFLIVFPIGARLFLAGAFTTLTGRFGLRGSWELTAHIEKADLYAVVFLVTLLSLIPLGLCVLVHVHFVMTYTFDPWTIGTASQLLTPPALEYFLLYGASTILGCFLGGVPVARLYQFGQTHTAV